MKGLLAILQVLIWFPAIFCFLALGYNTLAGMFRSTALLAKLVQEKDTLPTKEKVDRIVKAKYWSRYGQWIVGIVVCMGVMFVLRMLDKLIAY